MTSDAQAPLTVQATALSRIPTSSQQSCVLVIGSNASSPPFPPDQAYYWFVVVNLKNLSVTVNTISNSNTIVPASVAAFANNPDYFLFVIGNQLTGSIVPQGGLYTFLQATGSGDALAQIEQVIGQLGTATIPAFSYVLAATMSQQDIPGFEAWSHSDTAMLTMQFMPVQVDGQWVYAPVQQSVSRAA